METKIATTAKVEFTVHLMLTAQEAGALDALLGYGDDAFIKVFYEKLGEHYMKPYEKGLRELFKQRGAISHQMDKIKSVKKLLEEVNKITPISV